MNTSMQLHYALNSYSNAYNEYVVQNVKKQPIIFKTTANTGERHDTVMCNSVAIQFLHLPLDLTDALKSLPNEEVKVEIRRGDVVKKFGDIIIPGRLVTAWQIRLFYLEKVMEMLDQHEIVGEGKAIFRKFERDNSGKGKYSWRVDDHNRVKMKRKTTPSVIADTTSDEDFEVITDTESDIPSSLLPPPPPPRVRAVTPRLSRRRLGGSSVENEGIPLVVRLTTKRRLYCDVLTVGSDVERKQLLSHDWILVENGDVDKLQVTIEFPLDGKDEYSGLLNPMQYIYVLYESLPINPTNITSAYLSPDGSSHMVQYDRPMKKVEVFATLYLDRDQAGSTWGLTPPVWDLNGISKRSDKDQTTALPEDHFFFSEAVSRTQTMVVNYAPETILYHKLYHNQAVDVRMYKFTVALVDREGVWYDADMPLERRADLKLSFI